jgi:Na+/H+ antiporter NhaD/arsenite permease-like protein
LTFFNSEIGKFYPGMPESSAVARLIVEKIPYLAAISAGSVFMGANSYIGNAPNFMVKAMAEEAGVKMPSFFGYIFKYSIPILVVLFIIMTFIFF